MINATEWLAECLKLCVNIYTKSDHDNENGFAKIWKSYSLMEIDEKIKIYQLLDKNLESKDIIFVCSCIMAYTDIHEVEDYVTDVMCLAKSGLNTSIMYEIMLRRYGKYISYEKIRNLHKKNVHMISERLDLKYDYMPLSARNKKRIIIATEQILSQLHAPTKIVCEYAYVLQKMMGYEVIILSSTSDAEIGLEYWYRPIVMDTVDSPTNCIELVYRDITLKVYQVKLSEGIDKYGDFFQIIHEFKPYFILSFGVLNPVVDICKWLTNFVAIAM